MTRLKPEDRFLGGHNFTRHNGGQTRKCRACGARVQGSARFGWMLFNDPAGRYDGPYENVPACAARVTTLKPSQLN